MLPGFVIVGETARILSASIIFWETTSILLGSKIVDETAKILQGSIIFGVTSRILPGSKIVGKTTRILQGSIIFGDLMIGLAWLWHFIAMFLSSSTLLLFLEFSITSSRVQ